jgi:hypothetical protein
MLQRQETEGQKQEKLFYAVASEEFGILYYYFCDMNCVELRPNYVLIRTDFFKADFIKDGRLPIKTL